MASNLGRRHGLTGERFGRLIVVEEVGSRNGKLLWRCSCDCGGQTIAPTGNLRSGNTKSCGCLRTDTKSNLSHGFSGHPVYRVWRDMIRRCHIPTCRSYRDYGGRGIAVHPEWRESFEEFERYVSALPRHGEPGMEFDRIDNDGNYEPGNVRWATDREQQRNKRNNRLITFRGESLTTVEWAERTGLPFTTIEGRLRLGWPVERALTKRRQPRRTGRAM
jgi:hypothetical protein